MLNDKSVLECVNRNNNNMTSTKKEKDEKHLPPPATAVDGGVSMMAKRGPSFVMGSPRNYIPQNTSQPVTRRLRPN